MPKLRTDIPFVFVDPLPSGGDEPIGDEGGEQGAPVIDEEMLVDVERVLIRQQLADERGKGSRG